MPNLDLKILDEDSLDYMVALAAMTSPRRWTNKDGVLVKLYIPKEVQEVLGYNLPEFAETIKETPGNVESEFYTTLVFLGISRRLGDMGKEKLMQLVGDIKRWSLEEKEAKENAGLATD